MRSLEHINQAEREHFTQCPQCAHWFDMRNLDEVFNHEHYLQRVPVLQYSYSVKVGKPIMYFKNEAPIIIN